MFVSLVGLEKEYRELEALTAAWLTHLAEYDRSGDFALDGYANTAVAVRTVCRMTPGVAKGHVDLARKLESLPAVAEAFGRGEITRAHAVAVANGLAAVVQHATDAIDGDGGASNDEKLRGRRRAHLSKTFDVMGVLDGLFDPADTDYLERSVKTEMERDRTAGDGRSTPQRRADAFMNLIRRGAVRAELGSVRAVSRHFVVAVDVDDFYSPERIEELRLEVRRSGYLSAATLERICCDAQISRVIMAGKSEVLDVGRTTRTVTRRLRSPPHRTLVPRRTDQSRQPEAVLLETPPRTTPTRRRDPHPQAHKPVRGTLTSRAGHTPTQNPIDCAPTAARIAVPDRRQYALARRCRPRRLRPDLASVYLDGLDPKDANDSRPGLHLDLRHCVVSPVRVEWCALG
jgi:hypothetical protein